MGKARINGLSGWTDPHNGGIYSILSDSGAQFMAQRTTNPATSYGHKVYTDKQIFTLTDTSDGKCTIEACSESQGESVLDFSTNYCDIHNLYCNEQFCNAISSFSTIETDVNPSNQSGGKNLTACGAPALATRAMACPGSAVATHAGIQVTATASATCDTVKKEMKARINGESGWTDPHNGGIYSILSDSGAQLLTQRTTNPATSYGHKVYTDKQIFTFTDESDGKCTIEACSESQG